MTECNRLANSLDGYEFTLLNSAKSLRSEGRAPRRARSASGHYSFPNRAFYRERCLRGTGGLAQANGSRNGRLLQSAGSRVDHPVCNRNWFGSLALATGGRSNKRQLTPAYDLCADFRISYLVSRVDAVSSACQGHFPACILFCSDGTGLNDDHSDRAPRWNPERGGNAVTRDAIFREEARRPGRAATDRVSGNAARLIADQMLDYYSLARRHTADHGRFA